MVVRAKERVQRTRKDVVARGKQETEGAVCVPGGEQGKARTRDSDVVPPREESMNESDGVITDGTVALRGGLRIGVVGDEQGASRVGEGVVELEACMGDADTGFL